MRKYILHRIAAMLPTTFGVLLLTFLLFHVVGGSPAEVVLGKNATAHSLAAFDARYGYDKPLLFGRWSPVRALVNVNSAKLEPDESSGMYRLPLSYVLTTGCYRIPVTRVYLLLESVQDRSVDERLIDAPDDNLVFYVPEGWKVRQIKVAGDLPRRLSIEKKNNSFFDSQFSHYLISLLKGDLGVSSECRIPVTQILKEGIGPSLSLTIPILLGSTFIGIMLGLICAACRGGPVDHAVLVFSTVLMSVNYVIWILAGQYLLAFKWELFPIWGFDSATYLVLPVLIGIFSGLGRDVRFFRAAVLDEVYKPYVRTAQAKGLSGSRIMLRHVLRNSLIPVITYVSLSIPFLFTGSLMLESFFGIPGLGSVSINAVHSSDMAVVRAVVIIGALFYQVIHLITDICYAWLDPRVRLA
ncbi:MAG: ABC transporter permease [Kiritimatiellia bacterium]